MVSNNYTKNESLSLTFKHLELIRVGYDPTVYVTSEGQGYVDLNIVVFSHPVVGAPRPFTLYVTTSDGTARML